MHRTSPAIKLALIYFLAGSIWIVISDQIVNLFIPPEADLLFKINITKGLIFVFLTTIVLFISSRTYLKKIQEESLEKEKTAEKLIKSEKKYKLLFEDNPRPMWVYDLATLKFIDVNQEATIKYGYTRDEFLSMTIRDIRPQEEIKKLDNYLDHRNKDVTYYDSPIWLHKLKDGTEIFVKILSHKIELEGKPCRLVISEDVSELVKKEKDLKESEAKYKRIFENILDVYYETTIEGTILEISPSIEILSSGQYTRDELIGKSVIGLYHDPVEREVYIEKLLKYKQVDDYMVKIINKNSRIIYCSITSRLIEENDTMKISGTIRDITVRKKYEEDLVKAKDNAEKADRLKSEFLAQMSHEIRTPLNTLINSSQFVREELTKEQYEELQEIFTIINLSGKRITKTVESLLSMSELQTGTYEPTFSKANLVDDILEDLVEEYKLPAEEKNLELSLNVKTSAPTVEVDSYSVTEIFSNLIDNAIKYTNKGRVDVNVYNENSFIKVEVKDTGKGISEEFLPHLFESFRQEQQGYTRKYDGNGLGLALVNKFCEINKLKIDVESIVGKGTVFTVTFPV